MIVGLNGAGKSTFIKLLCKFYKPSTGRITLNGFDIWSIPNNKYYSFIAAVFQDNVNFAFSIRENITMSENCDEEKVREILFDLKMDAYADRTSIHVTKIFSMDGVELSGGEGQKLSIARAIYKMLNCSYLTSRRQVLMQKRRLKTKQSSLYLIVWHQFKSQTTSPCSIKGGYLNTVHTKS